MQQFWGPAPQNQQLKSKTSFNHSKENEQLHFFLLLQGSQAQMNSSSITIPSNYRAEPQRNALHA